MLDYTGIRCPVCNKPFTQQDDIVVCPICGAPYHRDCYEQHGDCIFEDLHREHRDWQPPREEPAADPQPNAAAKVECPRCGTLNDRSSRFCTCCGVMLPTAVGAPQADPTQGQPKTYGGGYPVGGGTAPGPFSTVPFVFDPMGGVNPTEAMDAGVTFGEASKVVRTRTDYYMPTFHTICRTGRSRFNFSAFLFSGAWLLYRKQYKSGIFVSIIMLLLQIAYQCSLWLLADPALEALAVQAGIDVNTAALTQQQILTLSNYAAQDMGAYLKIISPILFLLLTLLVMILVGARANRMYCKHCMKTVREVKASDGDPNVTYQAKGGVNPMAALCASICYSILNTFLPILFL